MNEILDYWWVVFLGGLSLFIYGLLIRKTDDIGTRLAHSSILEDWIFLLPLWVIGLLIMIGSIILAVVRK